LFPAGNNALPKQTTLIKFASVGEYRSFFDSSAQASAQTSDDLGDFGVAAQLEDRFFHMEVHLDKLSFLQQF